MRYEQWAFSSFRPFVQDRNQGKHTAKLTVLEKVVVSFCVLGLLMAKKINLLFVARLIVVKIQLAINAYCVRHLTRKGLQSHECGCSFCGKQFIE